MDRSDVITLVSETYTQNQYGVSVPTIEKADVFCQVNSVTAQEFFEGGRNGLNPEYRFTMFAPDYSGQKTVLYNGKPYGIYRTYLGRDDTIELYAERKGGSNGYDYTGPAGGTSTENSVGVSG